MDAKKQDGKTPRIIVKILGFQHVRDQKKLAKQQPNFINHSYSLPCAHWLVYYTILQKKKNMNLWQNWKHFFLWQLEFHTINKVTLSTLAPLFVNGLCSKISGLIKRQKIRWETTSLTKLLTIAEQLGPWSNIANKICHAINFIATIVPRPETPN